MSFRRCRWNWGYENLLEVLKNPRSEEYDHFQEWSGGAFDPERFDLQEVNIKLAKIR
ncbi:MAG: hypothetical protein Q8906_16660 [Bacillota bacterium]|nr:hypothetical protein [Bacillota bacterium]